MENARRAAAAGAAAGENPREDTGSPRTAAGARDSDKDQVAGGPEGIEQPEGAVVAPDGALEEPDGAVEALDVPTEELDVPTSLKVEIPASCTEAVAPYHSRRRRVGPDGSSTVGPSWGSWRLGRVGAALWDLPWAQHCRIPSATTGDWIAVLDGLECALRSGPAQERRTI